VRHAVEIFLPLAKEEPEGSSGLAKTRNPETPPRKEVGLRIRTNG
jgi:hypothetical protein